MSAKACNKGCTPQSLPKPEYLLYARALKARADVLDAEEEATAITSVQAMQGVLDNAADYAQGNTETFLGLANEVFLGSKDTPLKHRIGFTLFDIDHRHLGEPPVHFGDAGVNTDLQDHSRDQLSRHFWFYVNGGYNLEKSWGALGMFYTNAVNAFHELFQKGGSSKQDYHLGLLGLKLGQKLAKGELTPQQLTQELPEVLTNKKYYPAEWESSFIQGFLPNAQPQSA